MDAKSASRIQAHADKTDTNQDFKARAQSAAEKNEDEDSWWSRVTLCFPILCLMGSMELADSVNGMRRDYRCIGVSIYNLSLMKYYE